MTNQQKAIVYLSIVIVVLLGVIWYISSGNDLVNSNKKLIENEIIKNNIRLENDSLKLNEQVSVDKRDSTDVVIATQDGTIVEIKYIYKDAKINLFSLSTDSSFMLFSDNLSKADSLRW